MSIGKWGRQDTYGGKLVELVANATRRACHQRLNEHGGATRLDSRGLLGSWR